MSDIQTIRNIGPKMADWFEKAQINTAAEIHDMGCDEAYKRLIDSGMRPHFMAYLALDAGLKGLPFNAHGNSEKQALRRRHDAIVSRKENRPESNLEAILNEIGLTD